MSGNQLGVNYVPLQRCSFGNEQQPVRTEYVSAPTPQEKEGGLAKLCLTLACGAAAGAAAVYMARKGKASEAAGKVAEAGEKVAGKATEKVAEKASEVAQDASKKVSTFVGSLTDGIKDQKRLKVVNALMSGDKSANTIYRAQVKDAYIDMNRVLLNAKNSGSEDEQKIVEIIKDLEAKYIEQNKNNKLPNLAKKSSKALISELEKFDKEKEILIKKGDFIVETQKHFAPAEQNVISAKTELTSIEAEINNLTKKSGSKEEIKLLEEKRKSAEFALSKAEQELQKVKDDYVKDINEQVKTLKDIESNWLSIKGATKGSDLIMKRTAYLDDKVRVCEKALDIMKKAEEPMLDKIEEAKRLEKLSDMIKFARNKNDNNFVETLLKNNGFNNEKDFIKAKRISEIQLRQAQGLQLNRLQEELTEKECDVIKKLQDKYGIDLDKISREDLEKELKNANKARELWLDAGNYANRQDITDQIDALTLGGKLNKMLNSRFSKTDLEKEKDAFVQALSSNLEKRAQRIAIVNA